MEIQTILVMFMVGFGVAAIVTYYNKKFLGSLVRSLLEIDATSEESAISLSEIGIKLSPAMKHALRPGTSFSKTVVVTEDGKYYIEPSRVELAKSKYHDEKITVVFVLLILLILSAAALAVTYIFPDLLSMAKEQFSNVFNRGVSK